MATRFTVDLKKIRDNAPAFRQALAELRRYDLLVGFPEEKASKRKDGTISNAALAYVHDKGSPAANIPPRPFLEPGVRSAQSPIAAQLRKGATAAVEGNIAAVTQALNSAGLVAQAAVRRYITTASFTPLKPATLRARKRKGFKGEKPLIETGQLRNAVNYVLRNRRGAKPMVEEPLEKP
jgi:hypothetical protein